MRGREGGTYGRTDGRTDGGTEGRRDGGTEGGGMEGRWRERWREGVDGEGGGEVGNTNIWFISKLAKLQELCVINFYYKIFTHIYGLIRLSSERG